MTPSFSIITAVLNGERTIRHCLESIQAQTVRVEHIVVDGKSTDNTLAAVRDQKTSPIVISEPDQGIYDGMRKGIARAQGDIVGLLNADDFYASTHVLQRVSEVFADTKVDSCYGDLVYVWESGGGGRKSEVGASVGEPNNREPITNNQRQTKCQQPTTAPSEFRLPNEKAVRHWRAGPMSNKSFYWGWMPPHPTFFVRRAVYERYGSFRLDMGTAADYELMLRFLVKYRISTRYIPEVLVKMRVGGVSNASLKKRLLANRNDRKAWAVNGLRPYPWTLWLKPLRKLRQWVRA